MHDLRILASQVDGRTENSRRLALYLKELMDPSRKYTWNIEQYWWQKKQEWLRAFFQDEPGWELRVRTWIASFEEQ